MSTWRVAFVIACVWAGSSRAEEPRRILDFGAPDAARRWQAVNDGVMGGVSEGRYRMTDAGTMEFSGRLSLENNGGFASVRSRGADLGFARGDRVVIRARGDGREYVVNLYTRSGRMAFSYRAALPTIDGQWSETTIALEDFIPTSFGRRVAGMGAVDPGEITGLGFMLSDKRPGPFRLEVESIEVQSGPPATGR